MDDSSSACSRRFVLLAFGTIFFVQLSCVLEEWIFKQLPGFGFHWTVAFVELVLFAVLGHAANAERGKLFAAPERSGPLSLYLGVGLSLAAGSGLGKVAFKYLNYATGTVVKSMKLLPVMALSVCWLRRRYSWLEVLAATLMVVSAACFSLGEAQLEPDFNPLGLVLSFFCLVAQSLQNNCQDRLLRDHGTGVHETMLWSNGFGAVAVLSIIVLNGELWPAARYFGGSAQYSALLLLRCGFFYIGALLYTMLMKDAGAVQAVTVTTMRKSLTVLCSFLIFPKPWSPKYGVGLVLLLVAIVLDYKGRAAAKQRGAELVSASHRWRHSTLQIWPRSLPEVLFASRQLGVDVDTQPALLWLVDAIIASSHLPVAWSQKTRLSSYSSYAEDEQQTTLSRLSSTERLRFMSHGEVPKYLHVLLNISSEQHPMLTAAKDAEQSLTKPQRIPGV